METKNKGTNRRGRGGALDAIHMKLFQNKLAPLDSNLIARASASRTSYLGSFGGSVTSKMIGDPQDSKEYILKYKDKNGKDVEKNVTSEVAKLFEELKPEPEISSAPEA